MHRFKLDENLGAWCKRLFQNAGLEADTVADENIQGIDDEALFAITIQEKAVPHHA